MINGTLSAFSGLIIIENRCSGNDNGDDAEEADIEKIKTEVQD